MSGHSVLQVPVPALEAFVRSRWAHYDPALVSAHPAYVHAHVTALGPFLPHLDPAAEAAVAQVAAGTAAFAFTLAEVAAFPDGVVHLAPSPDRGFAALTDRLVAAFPQCPPYAGAFPGSRPHLTLDALSPGVSVASTRAALAALLPVRCRAERLDLAWYEPGGTRLLCSWPLG